MNANNVCHFVGRIPETDKIKYDFRESKKEGGYALMSGSISVRRTRKANKDDKFAPDDLIRFKVWGKSAEYMRDYVHRGDYVSITGELQQEDDWTDDDGNKHYGNWVIMVDSVAGLGKRAKDTDTDDSADADAVDDETPKQEVKKNNPFRKGGMFKKTA